MTGVIDVNRSKEKGYGTLVREGFCDEVILLVFSTVLNLNVKSKFVH